jgi:hypothetical protein
MKQCSLKVTYGIGTVLLLIAGSATAVAEESGQWFGRGVLVAVSSKSAKAEDRPDHNLSVAEYDGAVFNADGKPFLDKARYQIIDFTDSGVSAIGYKTFTEADGSKVFAKYTVKEVKLPDILGVFEFTGGTGRYAGITGGGEFHVGVVSDAAQWDELHGRYTIPASGSAPAAGMPTASK